MARIGFVGLGNMGGPMAANLVRAGHGVVGFDIVPASRDQAAAAGVAIAASPQAAASGAEFILTMLPAGIEARKVWLGGGGLLAAAPEGSLLIDSSTIDVATARALGVAAEKRGLAMIDAPVSGGVAGANSGTLTFIVGGTADAYARARPVLAAMGKNIFHAGGPGLGQAAKICNNMILGISMIAVAEAFTLAAAVGLEAQKLYDIVSVSSGQCWSLTSYCPVAGPVPSSPANRDYAPGFTAAMMLKDLALAQEAARQANAATTLGAAAEALYRRYCDEGAGGADFSGIIRMIQEAVLPMRPSC